MKKTLMIFILSIFFLSAHSFAEDWGSFVRDSMKQSPSSSKRQRPSGQRLLREKKERIVEIDAEVPILIQRGDYPGAENLLKEALRLTIEIYHTENIHVAERFINLGIFYMKSDSPRDASDVFEWGIRIGEQIVGGGNISLANAYRLLAAAYYEQGRYDQAERYANRYFDICMSYFGQDDPRTGEAKTFLREIYKRGQ